MKNISLTLSRFSLRIPLLALSLTLIGLLWLAVPSQAQEPALHPDFPLLDAQGENVLESGQPLSIMKTCGSCHDSAYIESHSFHSSLGLTDFTRAGQTGSNRPWDMSPGPFGKWEPLRYHYLTPPGDDLFDLGTAAWVQQFGARHVGGGPAERSPDGTPLTELPLKANDPQTHVLDPASGQVVPWNWAESGVVEMNCFLCHTASPNNEARVAELEAGRFKWANTATLLGSGLVEKTGDTFQWNPASFTAAGELAAPLSTMRDPSNDNCALCHGIIHTSLDEPLVTAGGDPTQWQTDTTGQVMSPQRILDSGVNLAGKGDLARPWDIHTERQVDCVDCHYSLNNPIYYEESDETRPSHLLFDARRLDFSDYLEQPDHQLARGQSAQNSLAPELKGTMRRCESCHSTETTHGWLPYKESHIAAISCESCHIPKIYSPARQQIDWTVLTPGGEPRRSYRGIEGPVGDIASLVTGYEPVLLSRQNIDGQQKLAPYNLISTWFWVHGHPARPVRLVDLQAAYLESEGYHPQVVAAFDEDGSGQIEERELQIDTPAKEAIITERLTALGLTNPRISAEVQPYSINHNVTDGEWVTKACAECHTASSRLSRPMELAAYVPGGVLPEFVPDTNVNITGQMSLDADGSLIYQPTTAADELYVLGHNRVPWVDWVGAIALLGTLGGISLHGGLRFMAALKLKNHRHPALQPVYMYTVYERLWHWLQALAIILLIVTGLIIHRPDMFSLFSFGGIVLLHNILGFGLLLNAFLAAFYHLASGEIKQYLPQPQGFFNQAITQLIFYTRGIFRDEEHPFEKNPQKKLNPLQQITYFGILNVLLPLQVITGVMMWGLQHWPTLGTALGGLPYLAPFHTLVAWLFATFIIMHIYLTTTGHTPTANIKAMIVGWDEVEVHDKKELNPL